MILTDAHRQLLGELAAWQILALADVPDYWCKYIRDGQGGGSVRRDRDVWPAGYHRSTYPWGIAITADGDYLRACKVGDPVHAATMTWAQITRWAESLPAELRAEARRSRKAGHDIGRALAARIIDHRDEPKHAAWEQLDLFDDRPERPGAAA